MQQDELRVVTLKAEPGKWITQKGETQSRTFAQILYLAQNDSPDNWEEWTDEQRTTWQQEQQRHEAVQDNTEAEQ